jgi:hypothetical protein
VLFDLVNDRTFNFGGKEPVNKLKKAFETLRALFCKEMTNSKNCQEHFQLILNNLSSLNVASAASNESISKQKDVKQIIDFIKFLSTQQRALLLKLNIYKYVDLGYFGKYVD